MKKFAPLMIAAAAMTSFAGCVAETGEQPIAEDTEGATQCFNPEGTNAAIAALATGMAQEMHRWQIVSDFEVFTGYNNQKNLRLSQAGKNACGGSCPITENLLLAQDTRMDQKLIFNGVRLSSWSFASRLVSGYDKQKSCNTGGWCPYAAHTFGYNFTAAPGACDTLFTFPAMKPQSAGGGNLTAAQLAGLKNALVWASANGDNPYIAFQSTASTVTIDPTGQMNPPGQATGAEICQKFSTTSLNGTPCTCATTAVTNGQLKNDEPSMTKTYFCRQLP